MCYCHKPIKVIVAEAQSEYTSQASSKENPKDVKGPVVLKIESKLTEAQKTLFETRFAEGYDVTHLDLNTLNADEKNEYMYWKAWRTVMFQDKPGTSREEDIVMPDDKSAHDDSDEEWQPPTNIPVEVEEKNLPLKTDCYYAVFLTLRRKKIFYIGRCIEKNDDDTVEIKFLERNLLSSEYDWPRRDDIMCVQQSHLLGKVHFNGPPPFKLSPEEHDYLQKLAKKCKV